MFNNSVQKHITVPHSLSNTSIMKITDYPETVDDINYVPDEVLKFCEFKFYICIENI